MIYSKSFSKPLKHISLILSTMGRSYSTNPTLVMRTLRHKEIIYLNLHSLQGKEAEFKSHVKTHILFFFKTHILNHCVILPQKKNTLRSELEMLNIWKNMPVNVWFLKVVIPCSNVSFPPIYVKSQRT